MASVSRQSKKALSTSGIIRQPAPLFTLLGCIQLACLGKVKMPDDSDIIELFEDALDRLILVGHKQGLSYPMIFCCILQRLQNMVIQCTAEQWLDQYQKPQD